MHNKKEDIYIILNWARGNGYGNQKTVRRGYHGRYGLEKIFEDLNLIEGNENDIGPAVRANE
jgi:hypothetical protein